MAECADPAPGGAPRGAAPPSRPRARLFAGLCACCASAVLLRCCPRAQALAAPARWAGGPTLAAPGARLGVPGAGRAWAAGGQPPRRAAAGDEASVAAQSRARRALQTVKKNGPGYFCALWFCSAMNGFGLFAISWALFVRATGASPINFDTRLPVALNVALLLLRPSRINPKYLMYHAAVYVSLSWITRPARFAVAVPLTRYSNRFFDTIQKRFKCPKFIAWVFALVVPFVISAPFLAAAVYLTCAVVGVPVVGK